MKVKQLMLLRKLWSDQICIVYLCLDAKWTTVQNIMYIECTSCLYQRDTLDVVSSVSRLMFKEEIRVWNLNTKHERKQNVSSSCWKIDWWFYFAMFNDI